MRTVGIVYLVVTMTFLGYLRNRFARGKIETFEATVLSIAALIWPIALPYLAVCAAYAVITNHTHRKRL